MVIGKIAKTTLDILKSPKKKDNPINAMNKTERKCDPKMVSLLFFGNAHKPIMKQETVLTIEPTINQFFVDLTASLSLSDLAQ